MARRRQRPRLPETLLLAGLLIVSLGGCVPAAIAAACVGACAIGTTAAALATRERAATLTLEVDGLACTSCSDDIRDALKRLDGVEDAQVNAAEKRVTVAYFPSKVTNQRLIETLNGLGYSAKLTDGAARADGNSGGGHDVSPKP